MWVSGIQLSFRLHSLGNLHLLNIDVFKLKSQQVKNIKTHTYWKFTGY